ncbi:MAG: PilC/PilY family type IV pilus protein [Rhodocyclaceae bacterium]|nr:PilC/PilY family type IV pilus protein [Rhodocyclaceae bacterium]
MKNRFLSAFVALTLLIFHLPTLAEDTDLFVGIPPAANDLPNVLLLVDNTANWNTAFTNEMNALRSVIDNLPPNKFRVGVMFFTESGGGDTGEDGGYIRSAIRTLDANYKTKLSALATSFHVLNDKSNSGKLGKAMADAYYYFAGKAPYTGNNKNKTDYLGNVFGTAQSKAIYALPGNALNAKAGSPYNSPILPDTCAKNFIIYISNGAAQDSNADTVAATAQLSSSALAAGVANATTAIAISPSGSQTNVGDEWARFMKKSPQSITTYTIDIDKVTTGQGPGWTALLKSMAGVSNGKYFDVQSATASGQEISNALNTIFSEIQSVNSVFAAVSLPVSVNTQGTYLNQVFVGMFRPDQDGLPRWAGNLKQYKLGYDGNTLKLLDANSSPAINSSTGFITECARSFWTPTTVDSYWATRPLGECLAVADSDRSNYPDGNIVEKGGEAYMLRSTTTRTVKTCASTACSSLVDFNNTNVTQLMLGAASTAERDKLINWARGLDVNDENINAVTTTEMRMSAHGDVVHSRPVAINFGTDVSPQVVVFYGGNDGVLRAVNGNRSGSIGSIPAGGELWGFIPPEFHASIKRIHDNNVTINYPGNTATSPVPLPKPYAFDGPMVAHKDGSTAWLFASMRRGGRALYAFNVGTPATPSLMWRVGTATPGFANLGQTWSAPKVFKTDFSGGVPLLIFGGGYDTCEDVDPNNCSTPTGNRVYVLNAQTGALLNTFNTDRSVIADVFVVPDVVTGKGKYVYVADTGGNVYRISGATANTDFADTNPTAWTITKIASLGCDSVTSCPNNRKFQHSPDVVLDEDGSYVILLGSGDREKPLASYTAAASVSNHFFMLRDKPSDTNWLSSETGNCGSALICKNSLYPIITSATPSAAQLATKPKGWYLGLSATEQVVTSALTIFGSVAFSTHIPATYQPGVCTPSLGTATVYNIDFSNAQSTIASGLRGQAISGGGLPPSPVGGMVTLDDGRTVPFIIGASPSSALEGSPAPKIHTVTRPKGRVYWQIQK